MRWRSATVLLAFLVAAPCRAGARSLVIERFDATVTVARDASITVVEAITPRFAGEWNGIYRTVPVDYRTPQGFAYALLLDVLGATDDSGHPLRLEVSRERGYKKIKVWIPGARDARRPLALVYRVENGLRFFADHDELYWNVTGDEWDVPIEAASARIVLPDVATGLRAVAYTGVRGSREHAADVEVRGREVQVHMRRPLAFREGLTVAIAWDKGAVVEPDLVARARMFLRANWPLAVPLAVFAIMLRLWWTRGRDPRGRPIAVRYEPPDGLRPAEVGTLLDNSADLRDLTATLVDLAVRGLLLIEERRTTTAFGLWSSAAYTFRLRRARDTWHGLAPWEREFLETLFAGSRDVVELADLENVFYKHIPAIRDGIFEGLVVRSFYAQRPDRVLQWWTVGAIALGLVLGAGGIAMAARSQAAPLPYVVAAAVSGAIVLAFARIMPARTREGTRAREAALGFEEFLSRVETDRFDRIVKTPELFEKFLPFAMALGVDRTWVRAFADICRQPPAWYRGPDGGVFEPRAFGDDLRRMTTAAASTLASAPRSSGGSGFSSGGSSGGGFGGGGGGGF